MGNSEDFSVTFHKRKTMLPSGEITYYEKGTGSTLLYLHSADGLIRSQVLERLASTHRVIAPVFPGFDDTSPIVGINNMEALAEISYELLSCLKINQADIIGFSFGGWVACWLASLYPDLVKHLILLAPAGFRRKPMSSATREEWTYLLTKYPEKAFQRPKSYALKKKNQQYVQHYHGSVSFDDQLLKKLEDVSISTLIAFGVEDKVMPLECGKILKRALRNAQLISFHDARHALEIDQPDRLYECLDRFLHK